MATALHRGVDLRLVSLSAGLVLIQLHPQVSRLLKERNLNGPPKDFEKKKSNTNLLLLDVNLWLTLLYAWHDWIRV